MPSRIIKTEAERSKFMLFVQQVKLPVTFEWVLGSRRTHQQNKLMWSWVGEVSEQRGDSTPTEIQREWKLRHGVPILRSDSTEFNDFIETALLGLSYEKRMLAMDFVSITSIMKVPQMIKFMDVVQRECLQQGFDLTDPDHDLEKYMNRYRDKSQIDFE